VSDTPREGETWVNAKGAIRHVRDVDESTVVYSRPRPARPDWVTIRLSDWKIWVENTNAVRKVKAQKVIDKGWGYRTP
jgi:hypothetical protein